MRKLHLTKKAALCMAAAFLALAAAGCSGNGEAAETSQAETSASQDGAGESGTEKAAEETEGMVRVVSGEALKNWVAWFSVPAEGSHISYLPKTISSGSSKNFQTPLST